MTVITTRSAARHPTSSIVLTGPRARQASRSRKTRPSFQKCRILPCPFRPVRTVYEPQRPTCANPGQGCRFWGGRGVPFLGSPRAATTTRTRNYHPGPQLLPRTRTTVSNRNYRPRPQLTPRTITTAPDPMPSSGRKYRPGPQQSPRALVWISFFFGAARETVSSRRSNN